MKRKVVLFKGDIELLNMFSDQLKKGFEELGDYEIFEFDLRDIVKSLGAFYTFLQEGPVTAMIGFNNAFYGMTLPSGVKVCEQLKIPCINILVDHPYWYADILGKMPRETGIVLCIDRGHMDFINRFYPQIAVNGFLPHGGTKMRGVPKPLKERTADVFYGGSLYLDYAGKQKPDFGKWDFPAEKICGETIEMLLADPRPTIESVLEKNLRKHGIDLTEEELARFISSCVYIERVVSSHYREKILSGIAKAGISLELYGRGWENCDWFHLPNVHYGGLISPPEVLARMENAKIVLNTVPWFRDGSHERIFDGMLRKAAVCSETSRYFEETLPKDTWMSYDLTPDSLRSLPDRIKSLLADQGAMQEMADKGYEFAKEDHTWQARVRELDRDLLGMWE